MIRGQKERLRHLLKYAGKGRNSELNLLLVDDAEMNHPQVLSSLEAIGVVPNRIFTAGDGQEAIKIIRKEPVNLMFTDFHMPRMGGDQLLHILKALKKLDEICVVLLTVEHDQKVITPLLNLGLAAYIRKPIDADTMRPLLD